MKKTLVSALTTALVVGAASTTFAAANPFSDVPADHWAYDAVSQLAADGVINGYAADGTFKGDATMTRYEMAQIVAKAMAKSDVTPATKAMIDKLAAEFSDELANLGVRVAALENKVDNVKWAGWIRYQYQMKDGETQDNKETTQKTHLRMNVAMDVNEHWTAYARLRYESNFDKNDDEVAAAFDRAWAQGEYKNLTVRLGKFEHFSNPTHGFLMEKKLSGASVEYGKDVTVTVLGGRTEFDTLKFDGGKWKDNDEVKENSNVMGAELRYVGSKFDAGAVYYKYDNLNMYDAAHNKVGLPLKAGKDSMAIWGLGAGYKFSDKWQVTADYGHSSDLEDVYKNDYRFQVIWGQQDAQKPGSFNLNLQYRKRGVIGGLGHQGDWAASSADRGVALISNITLDKNIITELAYYRGYKYDGVGDRDNQAFWGQLQFIF